MLLESLPCVRSSSKWKPGNLPGETSRKSSGKVLQETIESQERTKKDGKILLQRKSVKSFSCVHKLWSLYISLFSARSEIFNSFTRGNWPILVLYKMAKWPQIWKLVKKYFVFLCEMFWICGWIFLVFFNESYDLYVDLLENPTVENLSVSTGRECLQSFLNPQILWGCKKLLLSGFSENIFLVAPQCTELGENLVSMQRRQV